MSTHMKVLVIDEDKFACNIYKSELYQQNVEVIFGTDGIDGEKKIKTEKPDLIILELILTKKNGFDVLAGIKGNPKTKNIPVIACSALSQQCDIDEALGLGATKYFSKETYSVKQVVKEVLDILISK